MISKSVIWVLKRWRNAMMSKATILMWKRGDSVGLVLTGIATTGTVGCSAIMTGEEASGMATIVMILIGDTVDGAAEDGTDMAAADSATIAVLEGADDF